MFKCTAIFKEAQFQQLKKQLEEISTTTKSILATKVAEKLTALIPPTKEQTASAPEQPLVLSSSTERHPSVTMSAEVIEESHDSTTQEPSVLLATEEVEVGNMSIEEDDSDLLPSSLLTPIYVKSCSRRNFAVRIIRHVIDKETRKCSNVSGRGKEKLDPQVVKYAKDKCFEYFPCATSAVKDEWSKCVISIDESCRRLNKPTRSSAVETE